jgi:Dyp-type peroxidase family
VITGRHQVEEVFRQEGGTLPAGLVGHEHFGFMDGISQPGVKQFHEPDPSRPEFHEDKLGERLTAAGEFVLGYEDAAGQTVTEPPWMRDGSFQVLRRLQQDVAGWNKLVEERAEETGLSPEQLGAKLVGRWKSGVPAALSPDQDEGEVTNDFDYEDDRPGHNTPLFGHIRKTYPRTAGQRFGEDRHRIMRRGIPFGEPFNPGDGYGEGEDAERGLVFNMYCADIANQFEFLQQSWANNASFPPDQDPPHGPDPVIGADGRLSLRRQQGEHGLDWRRFVHTRGAVYAFCPSKSALAQLAGGQL